ncbi:hypothetical protein AAZX31_16G102700 [Glycine max]
MKTKITKRYLKTSWLAHNKKKNDLAWGHYKQIEEGATKLTMMCFYCDNQVKGGGINRFKAHLTRQKGKVEVCKKVLLEFSIPIINQIIENCDKAIAKWIMDVLVPFNAILGLQAPIELTSVNLAYYQSMIDAISSMSPGYKAPNFYRIRGPFVKYLFKEMMLYVGAENVHIMIDNATNYVAAGRLLEKEFPELYWPPCVAYYINLMLQDFGKFEEYVYNYCYALFLMRQHIGGRDILRPAPTQFATNFIVLQSILAQKDALKAMAKKFMEQILDFGFWKQCADIVKLTEPLVCVIRIVDSEHKPTIGFLYQAMYKAREEMLRRRWDSQLHKDLYATGYWLNLPFRFNAEEFENHKDTQFGILELIGRYTLGDLENKLEHQKLNDLVYVRYNLRLLDKQQNYDPINLETLDDHSNWVLEESPLFLTCKEVEALRNDLANMFIQSTSYDIDMYHLYKLNLDEDEDDDVSQPPNNTMKDVNPNESNIGEESHSFDGETLPKVDPTLTPWI